MTNGPLATTWWWWPASSAPHARPVLFFPPAGADQTIARALVAPLAAQRFGVLRMPGRGTRSDEPAPRRMTDLVAEIARSIRTLPGPAPVLVGHSFGGLLAYGTAHALQSDGHPAARLVTLASQSPRSWMAVLEKHHVSFDRDPDANRVATFVGDRVQRLLREGGIPSELGSGEIGTEAEIRMVTDISLACAALPMEPLGCPITAVTARDDHLIDPGAVAAWAEATTAGCTLVTLPGDHFFYRGAPERLAALLAGEIDGLDGAYGSF